MCHSTGTRSGRVARCGTRGLLVTLALALAACQPAPARDLEGVPEPPARGSELPAGIAATVDGREITVAAIDERVTAARADPAVAAQLEGDDGGARLRQLQASILTQEIIANVVLAGAEELGVAVTEEDVAAMRRQLVAQAGGEEQFRLAAEQSHLPPSIVDAQLRGLAALRNLEEELAPDGPTPPVASPEPAAPPPGTAGASPTMEPTFNPAHAAVQQYITERLAGARVVVDNAYGRWDPSAGVVAPDEGPSPAAAEVPAGGEPPGEGPAE
jgi:hypothetical protein